MASNISSNKYNGVNLTSPAYSSPTTIDAGVTINGATGMGPDNGVYANSEWAVDNLGTITANGGGDGIELRGGGSVTNESDGQISGGYNGIAIFGGGSVDNFGAISGSSGADGVRLYGDSNRLTNETLGTITARTAVYSKGNDATVTNDGVLSGSYRGVELRSGTDYLANTAGATIAATNDDAVVVGSGASATVENAGTISGGAGHYSVYMGDTTNLLAVTAGAKFNGTVFANAGDTNTLELKSGDAVGAISQLGTQYRNFQTVTIDSAAAWDIAGTQAGIDASKIEGFNNHDRLDLTDLNFNAQDTATLNGTSDVLSIYGAGHTLLDTIQLDSAATGHLFQLVGDGTGKTFVEETDFAPCFCRGTMILTAAGEVAVERLSIGDMVVTLSGEALPLKWIGRRSYRDWTALGNRDVQPVCFKAGSIADHVPARDLLVSPEHAMLLDGVLVPAMHLVNGDSIVKVEGMDTIDYFHLEFDRHVAILAEGAATESFVDDESRMLFHNAEEYDRLYPNEPHSRYAEFCAPRVEDGAALDVIRQTLATRAAHLRPGGIAAPWGRRGKVELVTHTLIAGWAFSGADAGPIPLAILMNDAVVGRVVADRYRPDLEAAGIGDGRHGFRFLMAKGLCPESDHRIEVRRESDWTLLQA